MNDLRERVARAIAVANSGVYSPDPWQDWIAEADAAIAVGLKDLPDIEPVSMRVHEAWMDSKRQQGVISRKSEAGDELMVPYGELTEAAKDLDRGTVNAVYAAIKALAPTPPVAAEEG